MFDTIVNPSSGVPRQRWRTTVVSAVAHASAIIVLVLSTLYATDALPEPREPMAFFIAAPVPPPPPPAPPSAAEPEPARVKPVATKAVTPRRAPVLAKAPVAAPVEAPASITPETGLEGGELAAAAIEPGFETGIAGGVAGGILGGMITAPPPPPPVPAKPVRVGGEISAPRLIHRVDPEYPPIAVNAQIEGMVILEATVDTTGTVRETRVLRSHGVLDNAAVDAVQQWRYEPLLLNGKPTPFVLTVTVSFSLATS
ncbi:MAG TPA: energy transducer TonB [Vicinamibacterales bacterium]|nr:energy transducer TonB [Vicinamibacterales bacterium]